MGSRPAVKRNAQGQWEVWDFGQLPRVWHSCVWIAWQANPTNAGSTPGRRTLRWRHPGDDSPPGHHGVPLAMDIVLRAVIIYVIVFVFTRVLGRRELSTLQPFDLILLIIIGDLIQSGVTQTICPSPASCWCCAPSARCKSSPPISGSVPSAAPSPAGRADRPDRQRKTYRPQHAPRRLTLDDLAEKARLSQIGPSTK